MLYPFKDNIAKPAKNPTGKGFMGFNTKIFYAITMPYKCGSFLQDDAVCQMRNLGIQYKELEQERERTENRLAQLQKSMCEVEEGRSTMCL